MSDGHGTSSGPNVSVMITLGIGLGALLGLALARQAARRGHSEIVESVEELRERTQRVLSELSESVALLVDQTRAQVEHAVDAGRDFAAAQTQTLDEAIGHGAEEA